jgi:hypothetical protein
MRIIIIIFSCLLYGCINYGNHISSGNAVPLRENLVNVCDDSLLTSSKEIRIFFSEPIGVNQDYIELGSIYVEGAQYTTDEEMRISLMEEAFKIKAHAIIRTVASFKTRTSGYYSFKPLTDNVLATFQAKVYVGTAIRFKTKTQDLIGKQIQWSADSLY